MRSLLSPSVAFRQLLLLGMIATIAGAQVNVPLTVQESIYAGVTGVSRSQDPVTVGIPLADSANIVNVSQLTLTGTAVGQFRVLGRWPSGNIKWVQVDTLADLASAGGTNTGITLASTGGSGGNFGGADLATDGGATITVDTGGAVFVIKKANFNVFESVTVAGVPVISAGANTQGLVLNGPVFPTTTCVNVAACATPYTSAADAGSTAVIEENGPVRTVVKATGALINSGNTYMRYTVRMVFWKGKTKSKVTVTLRNADEGGSASFQSATKGFSSWEIRLVPNLTGAKDFIFGDHLSTTAAAFAGTENATLYQAYSNKLEEADWRADNCNALFIGQQFDKCVASPITRSSSAPFTYAQNGYEIRQGTTTLRSGSNTQYPSGWANVKDVNGVGIMAGHYQMASYWPKSLEIRNGGGELRIGVWPDQSQFSGGGGIPYYLAWPQYSVHDVFLDFHATALASPDAEFKKLQHHLIARANFNHYNNANAFFYPLPLPAEEDAYITNTLSAASLNNPGVPDLLPEVFRNKTWNRGGGANQTDLRLAYLYNWLQRGQTGKYLYASHFYRYLEEQGFPRSDGFNWRCDATVPGSCAGSSVNHNGQWDAFGNPHNNLIVSANLTTAVAPRVIIDQEHGHWYGMLDYYFVSGDENVKDAIMDGVLDRWLNPNIFNVSGAGPFNLRATGIALASAARLSDFLDTVGDAAAASQARVVGDMLVEKMIVPDLCVNNLGDNCPFGPLDGAGHPGNYGVSRHRGIPFGCCEAISVGGQNRRVALSFQISIMLRGVIEYFQERGPAWPRHTLVRDLAYGMARASIGEYFTNTGTVNTSGWGDVQWIDFDNTGNDSMLPSTNPNSVFVNESLWDIFYMLDEFTGNASTWENDFKMSLRTMRYINLNDDWGAYTMGAVIYRALHRPPNRLIDVTLNSATEGPAGTYTLNFSAPADVTGYDLRYHPTRTMQDWLGYNPTGATFQFAPTTNQPFFSGTRATLNVGSTTVTGLPTGMTTANFKLKATVPQDMTPPTGSITAPAAGSTVGGTVNVTVTAADDQGVASVQLKVNGVDVGLPAVVAPYTIAWNTTTFSNVGHSLTAVVTDTAGNQTTTSAVSVTVFNDLIPPTVTLTAPAAGSFLRGNAATVSATAADNIGVVGVQFLLNGTNLGTEDTTAPYSINFDTAITSDGAKTLAARARDAQGNTTTSSSVAVTIDNVSPTVTVTAPTAGALVAGTVTLTATAADVTSGVAGIQFKVDGVDVGAEDTSAPYSVSWTSSLVTNGSHTITAVARDAAGNIGASAAVTVSVDNGGPDTIAPTVSITSPADGTTVAGMITVSANASDNVAVVGVQFKVDGNNIGAEDTTSPFSVSLSTSTLTDGTHTITATARDAAGLTAIATVTATVANSVVLDTNTQYRVQSPDSSTQINCTGCTFAGAADVIPGQTLEVRRSGSNRNADTVVLRQGTINGQVTTLATTSGFTMSSPASVLQGVVITVITNNQTTFVGNTTPQTSNQVAVRGYLFRGAAPNTATLVASRVEVLQ